MTSPASAQIAGAGSLPPNGSSTYVVTDLRDTSNVVIPDGTRVDVSTLGNCNHRDIGGGCIFATAGTITNGTPSATYGDVGHTRSFVVTNGQVSVDLQVPANPEVGSRLLRTGCLPRLYVACKQASCRINTSPDHRWFGA